MLNNKLLFLLLAITPALTAMDRNRTRTSVQDVMRRAHFVADTQSKSHTLPQQRIQTARDTQAVYGTPKQEKTFYSQRPVETPSVPRTPQYIPYAYPPTPAPTITRPVYVQQPSAPVVIVRNVPTPPTIIIRETPQLVTYNYHSPHNSSPTAPVLSTTKNKDNEPWLSNKKKALIVAAVTSACIIAYLATRSPKSSYAKTVAPPKPITPITSGQQPIFDWESAYNRLSSKDKHTIDSLHLEQQDDYRTRLQKSAQEQQEINNVRQSTRAHADIIHAAQTQFLNYYYAYESQLDNAELAQSVVAACDRLTILYNYFKRQ